MEKKGNVFNYRKYLCSKIFEISDSISKDNKELGEEVKKLALFKSALISDFDHERADKLISEVKKINPSYADFLSGARSFTVDKALNDKFYLDICEVATKDIISRVKISPEDVFEAYSISGELFHMFDKTMCKKTYNTLNMRIIYLRRLLDNFIAEAFEREYSIDDYVERRRENEKDNRIVTNYLAEHFSGEVFSMEEIETILEEIEHEIATNDLDLDYYKRIYEDKPIRK